MTDPAPPTHPPFEKWPSIQRLSSETVIITEKIDGTNGVIHVPLTPDLPVLAGSRERWLTLPDGSLPDKAGDNFGFARWVDERKDVLRVALGAGTHFGEFHGKGIQRGYDAPGKAWASFSYWWAKELEPYREHGILVVPVMHAGPWEPSLFDDAIAALNTLGSVLYPGFLNPEGIVITFKNMRAAKFKKLCKNDTLHKSQLTKETP